MLLIKKLCNYHQAKASSYFPEKKTKLVFFIFFPEKVSNPQFQQRTVRLCMASLHIELPIAIKLDLLKIGAIKPVKRLVRCKHPCLITAFLVDKQTLLEASF